MTKELTLYQVATAIFHNNRWSGEEPFAYGPMSARDLEQIATVAARQLDIKVHVQTIKKLSDEDAAEALEYMLAALWALGFKTAGTVLTTEVDEQSPCCDNYSPDMVYHLVLRRWQLLCVNCRRVTQPGTEAS